MNLNDIFQELKQKISLSKGEEKKIRLDEVTTSAKTTEEEEVELDPITICVVLASDGVWDNWIYDNVQKFVMFKSCLKAIENDMVLGGQRVCKSLMLKNKSFAMSNFDRK